MTEDHDLIAEIEAEIAQARREMRERFIRHHRMKLFMWLLVFLILAGLILGALFADATGRAVEPVTIEQIINQPFNCDRPWCGPLV